MRLGKIAFVAMALAVLTVPVAQAHDGGWYQTRTNAALNVKNRFPGIRTVACAPDYKSRSMLWNGHRWWNHFWCSGALYGGDRFRLRYHQTSESNYTISNLTGVSIWALRGLE